MWYILESYIERLYGAFITNRNTLHFINDNEFGGVAPPRSVIKDNTPYICNFLKNLSINRKLKKKTINKQKKNNKKKNTTNSNKQEKKHRPETLLVPQKLKHKE